MNTGRRPKGSVGEAEGANTGLRWTTPDDLKAQVARYWDRGVLLRMQLTGEASFPLRLVLKGPASSDLTGHFEAVRAWIASLDGMRHIRIDRREVMHRVQGAQRIPQTVWVETLDDAVALIGKRGALSRFESVMMATKARCPALLPWLVRRPLQAIALAEVWARLLDVVAWMVAHPRPGIYLRQVDIPGIHTKFIEANCGVLAELLNLVLPPEAISAGETGVRRFASRYGFLDKPELIRFRVLDGRMALMSGPSRPDVTLDSDSFAKLDLPVRHVFVTENETNFLAFPPVRSSIVIFGAGYGWDALAKAKWLSQCSIQYWGDIDTHGFAILDSFRARFPHAESFLMDQATLMAHEGLWGTETDQVVHDLPRLTRDERGVFNLLRDNQIRGCLRLEQEMIGFGCLVAALNTIGLATEGKGRL